MVTIIVISTNNTVEIRRINPKAIQVCLRELSLGLSIGVIVALIAIILGALALTGNLKNKINFNSLSMKRKKPLYTPTKPWKFHDDFNKDTYDWSNDLWFLYDLMQRHMYTLVSGPGGTGKSTLLKRLRNLIETHTSMQCAVIAPTGVCRYEYFRNDDAYMDGNGAYDT